MPYYVHKVYQTQIKKVPVPYPVVKKEYVIVEKEKGHYGGGWEGGYGGEWW